MTIEGLTKDAIRRAICGVGVALSIMMPSSQAARADESADRVARWNELRKTIFATKTLANDDKVIRLEAPERALDAAIVPITLAMPTSIPMKGVYLVIDENPSPLAAHFVFGPAANTAQIGLRVRIDSFTYVHAVAEATDGKLYSTERFVKASGGCSAPIGMSDEEALQDVGVMRLKVRGEVAPSEPAKLTLMIRHPNFNGMQMNPDTRGYTPARFIRNIDVSYNGKLVFHMEGDISISSNPVFDFSMIPDTKGDLKVVAVDSQEGRWERNFKLPLQTN